MNKPEPHTQVTVAKLPPCDLHPILHPQEPVPNAAYDGKTTSGPWANMCAGCFRKNGIGLGLGKGQRLVLKGAT